MRKFFLLFTVIWFCGCDKDPKYVTVSGFAQGTTYNITYQECGVKDVQAQVDSLLANFDASLSNFNDSSLLSRVNKGDNVVVDEWFERCFDLSQIVHKVSGGLFDPSLRPLINAYGFGSAGERGFRELDAKQLAAVLDSVGLDKISIVDRKVLLPQGMSLDFSAIAQGYSVDLVSQMFDGMGIKNYIIEIGGEIYAKGLNSRGAFFRVGVDTPEEGNFVPGESISQVVELSGNGLATSGNYRKYFEKDGKKYSHAINPKSGLCSQDSLLSATIIAENAALADGYATACMVGGYAWSVEFVKNNNLKAYLIYRNYTGSMSTTIL